jgi:hypothetical protein
LAHPSKLLTLGAALPMSTSQQITGPRNTFKRIFNPTSQQITRHRDTFKRIFDPAVRKFEETTKKSLKHRPFAKKLEGCDTPEDVSKLFQTEAEVFNEF